MKKYSDYIAEKSKSANINEAKEFENFSFKDIKAALKNDILWGKKLNELGDVMNMEVTRTKKLRGTEQPNTSMDGVETAMFEVSIIIEIEQLT